MPKIEKIFVTISIIFLVTMISVFSYRFVYFYKKNNEIIETEKNIYNLVLAKKASANLYKINNSYFYRGKDVDNYVVYSGITWRIIRLYNNTLTLISDLPLTNLYFNDTYKDSKINNYLNNEFYNLLDNRLIIDTTTCIQNKDDISSCQEEYTDKVVLLSLDVYNKIDGINSFVNNGYYSYLSNTNEGNYYINSKGEIEKTENNNLYGIKPVITINSSDIYGGDGSINNPYLLDKPITILKDALIGNYILFSDKIFRITQKDENSVKLILNDVVNVKLDGNSYNNSIVYNYLNNEFYNTLDTSKIVNSKWNTGYFDGKLETITKNSIECKVGFANFNDLFINDIPNHALMSTSHLGEVIYYVKDNSTIYKDIISEYSIRPMLSIKNNINISGIGTLTSPYIIGDVVNEENN